MKRTCTNGGDLRGGLETRRRLTKKYVLHPSCHFDFEWLNMGLNNYTQRNYLDYCRLFMSDLSDGRIIFLCLFKAAEKLGDPGEEEVSWLQQRNGEGWREASWNGTWMHITYAIVTIWQLTIADLLTSWIYAFMLLCLNSDERSQKTERIPWRLRRRQRRPKILQVIILKHI